MSLSAILTPVLTLCLAVLGALGARWAGMPLPWMLGPMLATAGVALSGARIAGHMPNVPVRLRLFFIPIIGVMMGAKVSPDIVAEALRWWPSLLLILPYMLMIQSLNALILNRLGGYDPATAFFAASPGGLVEAVVIGEQNGGNTSLMALQHFARVALCVSIIPLLLSFDLGRPVGSAAALSGGASGPGMPSGLDIAFLTGAGVIGALIGLRLRIPAGIMVGPLALSAVLHAAGLTEAVMPVVLVQAAQLVIGTTLGVKFAGHDRRVLFRGFALSILLLTNTLLIAAAIGYVLGQFDLGQPEVIFIAFAPGGLVEMGLIAISLGADPIFVATHHIGRIILAVTVLPYVFAGFQKFQARRARAGSGGDTP